MKSEDTNEQVGKEIVKRRRVGNPALTGEGLMLEEGDNSKYIGVGMKLFMMKKVDLRDPAAVQERIAEYLQIYNDADMKPTVSGFAMALGIDRRRLWEIATGNTHGKEGLSTLPIETADLIKKTYDFLGTMWESYMQGGKINPVSGIFLGKNHFGYQDKQDVVITPNQPEGDYTGKEIADRYRLSDSSDSDS